MNEKQAYKQGYQFTGIYESAWKKDIVKQRAAEIRKQGFKACMVTTDRGYSVYAEHKYFVAENLKYNKDVLSRIDLERERAKKEYEQALREIDEKEARLLKSIAQAEEELKK